MNESHKGVCPNCKRLNSKHNDEEFLICTRKIMEDLILANENRTRIIGKQKKHPDQI